MPAIDLSGAVIQVNSPVIDGLNYDASRLTRKQYTITGSGFGSQPNVILFRRYREGADRQNFVEEPPSGEIGAWNTTGKNTGNQAVYVIDDDGFPALATRDPRNNSSMPMSIFFTPVNEFRECKLFKTYNDHSFAGTGVLDTAPSGSVLKDSWVMYQTGSEGVATEADICTPTFVNSGVKIQGNASQPFGTADAVLFADWWNFNSWNSFSYYCKNGTPNPISDSGVQCSMFGGVKTGTTKTAPTKIIRTTVPNHGSTTTVLAETSTFGKLACTSYYILSDAEKQTCVIRRNHYLAVGAESYQCAFFANSSTLTDASKWVAVKADSWSDTSVSATPDDYEQSWATHLIVLKPDGSESSLELV